MAEVMVAVLRAERVRAVSAMELGEKAAAVRGAVSMVGATAAVAMAAAAMAAAAKVVAAT